ncbi:aminopeptidase M1-A-like [Nylanderia fulva]|uniref:aminopeptidase M1-A-like n=1 Tax=Nylanderia fulva TaxID=613905 RepID=UPI0010FB7CDC|nr:aminopeptidase M1-A-like [Nylanderia fulva]
MPLRNTKLDMHNMLWIHNDTTPIMWIDHATIIVSNCLFRIDNEIIEMWTRIDAVFDIKFSNNVAINITLFFNNKWKHSNNISMVSHVAIPNFHDKGTIVFGLVLYRETDIIYNKYLYPIAHKIKVAQLVGRKVAQEWFYNMMNNPLVSISWFKNGLTTLLATYAVDKIYPDDRIINLFVVQNQHYSFHLDGDYHMWSSTSQVNRLLEIRNSIRAPFILRMMEHAFTKKILERSLS